MEELGGLHRGTGLGMLLWVEAGQRGGADTALPKVMARDAHQRDRGAE